MSLHQNVYAKKPIVKFFDKVISKFSKTVEESSQEEFLKIKKIELLNQNGSIIITSWEQKTVALEVIKKGSEENLKDIKIDKQIIDDILQINNITDPSIKHDVCFNILVPTNISLKLATQSGIILISQVEGPIEAENDNGHIKIKNCNNNIKAETAQGNISLKTTSIKKKKEISLHTKKGSIKVYLHQDIDVEIDAKAPHGKVSSELEISLYPFTTKLNPKAWSDFKKQAHGVIGTNKDSTVYATTDHGSITIMPYTK